MESDGCHLCEQAKQLLQQTHVVTYGCELVDIAESDALIEAFGERIPVLEHINSGQQLGWPFNFEQLNTWLQDVMNL
nr:glutaredoxin family protein [Echinimonas agarilytica]